MKKILILLPFLALLTSCAEDINLSVAKGPAKIVIEGNIENGQLAEVIITRNSALSDTVDFQKILVTDAKAWVSAGGVTDTLHFFINSSSAIPFVYRGSFLQGQVGETYNLTVIADGRTFTATTTIPALVPLDSVWWKAQAPETELGFAWAHFSDPLGMGNAYKWFAKRPKQTIILNGQPTILNRRYVSPNGGSFDDKFIDGKSFDFAYNRGYDPTEATYYKNEPKKEQGYFKITDTIYIKFCTIDNAASQFFSTYDQAVQSNGNPFAAPVHILSNIQGDGGLGVWAGYGATYDTIMPAP